MSTRRGYVIGVIVVWAIILGAARVSGSGEHVRSVALICFGFALGMVSAFIAASFHKS
ncbi:MAG TPA: hypothetical protein VKZ50_17990 [bacterium]|nr:hypothetical protein [bacterium]